MESGFGLETIQEGADGWDDSFVLCREQDSEDADDVESFLAGNRSSQHFIHQEPISAQFDRQSDRFRLPEIKLTHQSLQPSRLSRRSDDKKGRQGGMEPIELSTNRRGDEHLPEQVRQQALRLNRDEIGDAGSVADDDH